MASTPYIISALAETCLITQSAVDPAIDRKTVYVGSALRIY